jgi:outer membrane receptor protein involved in Fe transport
MRIQTKHVRAALIVSALFSTLAFATGKSIITGTVTDAASGKPVPDVVVTATSPALQGEETVVTDESGSYRIPQLPAGVYLLRLEKEGYKPFTRPDITIRLDRTVRVNIQVQPESLQSDTIVVVGKAPVVDVGSASTGLSVGKDFINNVAFLQPNGSGVRTFESLAAVAPQVSGDQYGYGFSGAQSPENLYLVDGVSTSDPAFGTNGAQFPVEFVDDANVVTGGYQAEYGRSTGGVLSVETKSGSNEFHGSLWGNWTPGALSGQAKEIANDGSIFVSKTQSWNTFDFGADVGGPIIKDKLWFYAGVAPSFVRTQQTRSMRRFLLTEDKKNFQFGEDGFIKSEPLENTTSNRFNDDRSISYIGKVTFAPTTNHSFALTAVGSPTFSTIPYSLTPRRVPGWNGGTDTIGNSSTVSLRYQASFFDKALLTDVSLGWFHLDSTSLPNDGSTVGNARMNGATGYPAIRLQRYNVGTDLNGDGAITAVDRRSPYSINDVETIDPASAALCEAKGSTSIKVTQVRGQDRVLYSCPVTGAGQSYTFGGSGYTAESALDRFQIRGSGSFLFQALGHHTMKAGLDIENLRYDIKKSYSGGVFLQENITGSRFDDLRQYGTLTGPDKGERQLFIRSVPSSWGVGAFAQDSWSIMDVVTLNAGLRYDTQQLFTSQGDLGMTLNNMLSPRLGLVYDFTQQGRSKIFANYARYYENVPISIADRSLTGENQYRFRHYKNPGANADGNNPGCNLNKDINQAFTVCDDPRNAQPINRLSGDEYSIHGSAVNTGSGKVPIDPNLIAQSNDEFVAGGEYEIIADGRVGATYTKRWMNNIIEDMSLDEGQTYFIGNPGYGLAAQFPKATRDYDAVTVFFNKTFSDGWMGQASYTWSSTRGNYNGLFRPETGQLDPNGSSDFDLISLLNNRTGALDADRTHQLKAFASKEFKLTPEIGLVVGLTYNGVSGRPINYLAAHQSYGADESFVLPRGSGGRLPWTHAVNGKLGLSYRFSKDNVIQVTGDVFNMFNFQAVTSVDETLSNSNLIPFTVAPGKDPQTTACLAGKDLMGCEGGILPIVKYNDVTTKIEPANQGDLNPNFKRPTSYQSPISVRFGVKFTF